jgi:hypothetical protein
MDLGGGSWGIITIVAPLLLIAVIAWAALRNRGSSRAEREETERATRDLYREEDIAHRNDDAHGT